MSNQCTIRVMLVDDHVVIRSGLAAYLTTYKDLQIVGEASNGEEAIRFCGTARPDVVVMDLQMPGMDGVTATRLLRQGFPEIQILILTGILEDSLVQDALEAGANGYLLKHVLADELVSAIRAVRHGQPALGPEAVRALISVTRRRQTPLLGHDLSERELEVLALIAKGFDNQRIAESLVISHATAKFHVGNILAKLCATSRTHAVIIAFEHKILSRFDYTSLHVDPEASPVSCGQLEHRQRLDPVALGRPS